MSIEKSFFRQIMGRFATGVTVVTTNHQGEIGGLTVNAFSSVSLNPPLVLVCVEQSSSTLPLIRKAQNFAINILTHEQEEISRSFASPTVDRFERFYRVPYHTSVTGAPIIDEAHAFIDTRVVAEYPGGDHSIFLGEVVALGTPTQTAFAEEASTPIALTSGFDEEKEPLLYYQGQYRKLAVQPREPSLSGGPEE